MIVSVLISENEPKTQSKALMQGRILNRKMQSCDQHSDCKYSVFILHTVPISSSVFTEMSLTNKLLKLLALFLFANQIFFHSDEQQTFSFWFQPQKVKICCFHVKGNSICPSFNFCSKKKKIWRRLKIFDRPTINRRFTKHENNPPFKSLGFKLRIIFSCRDENMLKHVDLNN